MIAKVERGEQPGEAEGLPVLVPEAQQPTRMITSSRRPPPSA